MITPVQKPVKNFDKGRGIWKPDCVVIHIAEGLRDSVYTEFSNQSLQVSTHYLINKDGSVWQFVNEADTAWGNGGIHNPKSALVLDRPHANPNSYSISIEHEGYAADGQMNELMYQTSVQLVKEICARWNIPVDADHIIRHRDITDRKTCPAFINVERIISMINTPTGDPVPVKPDPQDVRNLIASIETFLAQLKTLL